VQPRADLPETRSGPHPGALAPAEGPADLATTVRDRSADGQAASAVIAEAATEIRQLLTALDSREVIGQAKGILMERYRLTPDGAFALLARASQDTNVKLRAVAAELCRTGALPGHDDWRQRLAG
jgi:ANTAR domain-containing protein